jgi:hypothetical protein
MKHSITWLIYKVTKLEWFPLVCLRSSLIFVNKVEYITIPSVIIEEKYCLINK